MPSVNLSDVPYTSASRLECPECDGTKLGGKTSPCCSREPHEACWQEQQGTGRVAFMQNFAMKKLDRSFGERIFGLRVWSVESSFGFAQI